MLDGQVAGSTHLGMDGSAVNSSMPAVGAGLVRGDVSANRCPSLPQPVYYEDYQNMVGRWTTGFPDVSAEGLGKGPQGLYSDNRSHLFHGYGYTPDVQQTLCTSLPMLMPSVSHYGQYNEQQLPCVDSHYYQHVTSQNPMSLNKFPVQTDVQVDGSRFRPRAGYSSSWGSFGSGSNFLQNSEGMKFVRPGLEGEFESRGLWSSYKPVNGKLSSFQLSSSAASPKSAGSGFGMASLPKESYHGFGSRLGSDYRSLSQGRSDDHLGHELMPSSVFGSNGRNWPTLDEARQVGRCHELPCSCAVALDTLSERNRGPRAFRPKSPAMINGSAVDHCRKPVTDVSYNRLDFVTDYEDAKFFIIKSYSEDNVHKSIKYGVWASTQNGNKKLDAAYHEVQEKKKTCPVFLLFSVNASAQFCGVAEMVGVVDFDKSVDYWQQDKWSGQFPVKWHIIKDVPNSQFRHIVLENNDNKPVTNSRDTQEVELAQGIEMLKIFKNYESYSSILDDFIFYEERQKAMQARKSRQVSLASTPAIGVDKQSPISISSDFIKRMSKSFAEAVSVNDNVRKFSL